MAAPPDLRVLCRRLTSTPVEDLPRLCPVLVGHVLRCGSLLSAPQDAKPKDRSSDAPVLVHKLRTHITTLLTGKSPAGRFAAVFLVKAVIDVGGWESLRAAHPWIRGLIGVLQKPDPLASKELCVVTLTKIYMLLQGYPTLVREMATPTLPDYVSACLQLIKPPPTGKPLKVPATFVDTVTCSLSRLVVLYPTTLRPFAAAMRAALRAYLAPTCSDSALVPQSLREGSRRLFALLPYTAPKNGSGDEWVRGIRSTILDAHAALDHIFRSVIESWESTTGYRSQTPHTGPEPSGGGDSAEDLPPWSGVQAGAERVMGLLEFLAEYLNNPTKAPVTVPLGELLDLAARITLVTPPSGPEDSIATNPAIGRDEKAELWSVLPDIHIALLRLHRALIRRLGENALPLATDILDQMVRVCTASRHIPAMREATYALIADLLPLSGPTLPKLTVDSLAPLIQSTCRDILLAAGHLSPEPSQPTTTTTTATNGTAPTRTRQPHQRHTPTNADAYLPPSTTSSSSSSSVPFPALNPSHTQAATALLPLYLTRLPQRHLAPDLRGLLDRTAVLAHSRPAMLASCLHPYRDSRGRYWPSILPFLVRRFPADQEVEVLRSNLLRVAGAGGGGEGAGGEAGWDPRVGLEDLVASAGVAAAAAAAAGSGEGEGGVSGGEDGDDEVRAGAAAEGGEQDETKGDGKGEGGGGGAWGVRMDVDDGAAPAAGGSANPFATVTSTQTEGKRGRAASPLKRKSEGLEADAGKPPKRVDVGKAAAEVQVAVMPKVQPAEPKGDESEDSDSEGSVQIDMTLDDEDDEDDDEDDE